MAHLFDEDIAREYGVNAAIMIRHFQFWIVKNKANGTHLHDGRTWTYNTVEALAEIFDYWTPKQVRRILEGLLRKEVLIKGNYNITSYDRTSWYAFTDEERFIQTGKSNCPKGQMDKLKRANGFAGKGGPIPNPITNGLTDETTKETGLISAEKKLELDLKIAEERKVFTEQVSAIFRRFTGREKQTFARITMHLVEQCQANRLPVTIFRKAVEWAKTAQDSTAGNKKGLFVAKIKQETGFNRVKKLLDKIGRY